MNPVLNHIVTGNTSAQPSQGQKDIVRYHSGVRNCRWFHVCGESGFRWNLCITHTPRMGREFLKTRVPINVV